MQPKILLRAIIVITLLIKFNAISAQDSTKEKSYKNIIRYNLSGALFFGFDKYAIIGYERIINKNQSISINIGQASLPKLASINTDSFHLGKDAKNDGFNASIDYRFYLRRENKYGPPRGVYIGPFYSYNHFHRTNNWTLERLGGDDQLVKTDTKFNIHTIGAELGYQFVFWKRVTLDMVLIGPGFAAYDLSTDIENTLSEENKNQLQDALEQVITQKFPGMNYVFSDKHLDANGNVKTTSIGYRYMIHIGFAF
jgi:hypothetical protein